VRMTRMEEQQKRLEVLDKEFKDHVSVMNPIRDEVIGIKKLGKLALVASGAIPVIISAFVSIWHPWSDDTRAQLAPVEKSLADIQDRERADVSSINNAIQDLNYKTATLQSEVVSPSQTEASSGNKRVR
jgi:type II secretory pathway component PulM